MTLQCDGKRVQNRELNAPVTEEEFLSKFRKEDKIYPVIPLVFYYGLEPWDGSIDLHGMFHQSELFGKEGILKDYVPNYFLNLIDVGNIKDINRFQSDLQLIFGMLEYKQELDKLHIYVNEHKDYFENVDMETYQAMRELLHSGSKMKAVIKRTESGESINMCKALDDLYNRGVNQGLEQGLEKGIRALIKACQKLNISKIEIINQLEEEFSLTKEAADKYMEQYGR